MNNHEKQILDMYDKTIAAGMGLAKQAPNEDARKYVNDLLKSTVEKRNQFIESIAKRNGNSNFLLGAALFAIGIVVGNVVKAEIDEVTGA